MTMEEHSVIGGLGSAVAETLADAGAGLPSHAHRVERLFRPIGYGR